MSITYLSFLLYSIIGNSNYEVFRIDLGLKNSVELNTATDPRSFMKYALTDDYFFIADISNRRLIRADITKRRNQFISFLSQVNLLDLWVADTNLLVHSHGTSNFESYNIHNARKQQDFEFPMNLKYGGVRILSRSHCYFHSALGQAYVCRLVYADGKYAFEIPKAYTSNYLSTPILDDSTALHFSRIEVDNYIDQNQDYVLLRKTAHKSPWKYSPIYYVFDKNKKAFEQITFPKNVVQDLEGAAIRHDEIYLYGYDNRSYELLLYKIPIVELTLAPFDPVQYSFPDDN